MLSNHNALIVGGVAVVAAAEVLFIVYQWLAARRTLKDEQSLKTTPFHKVLFFPENKIPCKKYLLTPKVTHC